MDYIDANKPQTLTYEQPLNERMRTFLRVEHLYLGAWQCLKQPYWWDSRNCLVTISELLGLLERSDLKADVFKELDRQRKHLLKISEGPNVASDKLAQTLEEIDQAIEMLENSPGKIGLQLRQNDFLATIRQRLAIPGGTCNFDLPAYHRWLHLPYEQRAAILTQWLDEFKPICIPIDTVLHITRHSAYTQPVIATRGFFQKELDPKVPCQLIRLSVSNTQAYPEISGNKHQINVRFMRSDYENEQFKIEDNIPFNLTCCML